jgi:hypothetical protein
MAALVQLAALKRQLPMLLSRQLLPHDDLLLLQLCSVHQVGYGALSHLLLGIHLGSLGVGIRSS